MKKPAALLIIAHSTYTHTFLPIQCLFSNANMQTKNAIQTESHNTADSNSHNLDALHLIWLWILSFVTVIEQTMTLTHFHPSISFVSSRFFTRSRLKYPWLLLPRNTEIKMKKFVPHMRKLDSLLSCLLTLMSAAFTTVCSVLMKMHSDSGIT